MTLSKLTRRIVRERGRDRCEYCHSPERISTSRFTIDHIQPRSLEGSDDLENLALACSRCNQRRYNFIVGHDIESAETVSLFNPRQQIWADHFIWSADGTRILGTTPIGRATCYRLDMNDDRYQGERSITEARSLWVEAGWHPPSDDPRQAD
ncbi:HNH endonuclease [Leptolyngbya sp. GGD]|uniref:HNH endonuclease n=1 Tax=Leptolyngbya sp. GGD TaxID=2997907 RepID=UPI00227A9A09|nr:HNH endonuclease signature motif containing protein [Leptolyngbya sp. GGD]MCY6491732.1 HNH endonuclease signature motif containing protein [Leptolyngbya sp. GGD]